MICRYCGQETGKEYPHDLADVCDECLREKELI